MFTNVCANYTILSLSNIFLFNNILSFIFGKNILIKNYDDQNERYGE